MTKVRTDERVLQPSALGGLINGAIEGEIESATDRAGALVKSALFALVCGLTACSNSTTSSAPAADAAVVETLAAEASVRPDVNSNYKNPNIDVNTWAKRFTGESREVFAQRLNVLAAIDLEPGDRIADIGAGTGLYVKLFAQAVGATGKVYAVDISQPFLDFIAEKASADNLTNVTTLLGADRSSNLADASVDVVFHSDTYHHFEFPKTMIRDLARALDDDGEMYVLDFERIEGVTPQRMLNHVRAGKEVVIAEIESAGFDLVEEVDLPGLQENYLLRFRKE